MGLGIALAERGWLPDGLLRVGIRRLLQQRIDMGRADPEATIRWTESLRSAPIAVEQQAANSQHYEVPTAFYQAVLGHRLKYSSAWYADDATSLDEAEDTMLALSCERAELADGQDILEIGCGWGSLTLFMAERYPNSRILAISNSATQRAHIMGQCAARGFDNVEVRTVDLATFACERSVDRIVSVECLEHMRNYVELFKRFAAWLRPDGLAFVHVFCHATQAYPFETEGDDNWMGRHFFTGGQMPSWDLFSAYDSDLAVDQRWQVSGQHYARTSRHWLERLTARRGDLASLFPGLPAAEARRMYHRWRMFFMACEELFGWGSGDEWFVGHYRFRPVHAAVHESV